MGTKIVAAGCCKSLEILQALVMSHNLCFNGTCVKDKWGNDKKV